MGKTGKSAAGKKGPTSKTSKGAAASQTSGSMTGSIAFNLHEGSRSEYLAQFVFSWFGTAIPVPHQEDSGLDIYCTLLEKDGKRAWPRAYYSVQVKSTMSPWVFPSAASVRWIVEHPLPIFLCVVQKSQARILVYQTSPRFAAWILPKQPTYLKLIPGDDSKAETVSWGIGDTFQMRAPILSFTIDQMLDPAFRKRAAAVLKLWIDSDVENLFRIRCGIHQFRVPHEYETNSTKTSGLSLHGGKFRNDSLKIAEKRLKELLAELARHHFKNGNKVDAAIYATVLRRLSPQVYVPGEFDPHDVFLHMWLNDQFTKGKPASSPSYLYEAADSLLKSIQTTLAEHGVTEAAVANVPRND